MNNQLVLSNTFSIPAIDYAGQGNAILGIRDAGKTYTAMKAAEELLDNNIPIIVYDPVGVWKNLKIGIDKHIGYPVVTAGGEGSDIRLTVNNAVDIVRAAMKENVSLVIDLYSPELINKSSWIRIVQETVDLLMYENKSYGMRHIFIEEAAEFIPQRLQPQHSKVYASLERLARMGRNARLGYTLINQRAEEVNKAILEISAFSLLHKQVGKNSLKSIQQWLELRQVDNTKDIIKSLPGLKQGECWAIGLTENPQLIQVLERKTFHPDPKKSTEIIDSAKKKIDVTVWVEKLNKLLDKPVEQKKEKSVIKSVQTVSNDNEIVRLKDENVKLKQELKSKDTLIIQQKDYLQKLYKQINKVRSAFDLEPMAYFKSEVVNNIASKVVENPSKNFVNHNQKFAGNINKIENNNSSGQLGKCSYAVLQFLASFQDRFFSKAQVGIAAGYSPNSGGFNNAVSELFTKGLIKRENGKLQASGNLSEFNFTPQEYSIETYRNKLSKCEREIYDVLLANTHKDFSKEELAYKTESKYSFNSGGFNNALSALNTLELIKREGGRIRLNPELLELPGR